MSDDIRGEFFAGLRTRLVGTGLVARNPVTSTGMDIYLLVKGRVKITANIAPEQDRVSTKLTIERSRRGGPTPAFDALRKKYESLRELDGTETAWDPQPLLKESKIETQWSLGKTLDSELFVHYDSVVRNALILKRYAKEVAKLL